MEQNEKHIEINLLDLFHYLKKRAFIVLAAVLVFAVGGFLYSELFVDPVYRAETQLYVLSRSSTTAVNGNDFQLSDQILNDCKVLITGKSVTKPVVEQLGLKMSPGTLGGMISVSAVEQTRVLQIVVTDSDPQRAADIANKVCEVAAEVIQNITDDPDAVSQLYPADTYVNNPNTKRHMLIAALIGLLSSTFVMTVIFVLDDSIRSEEDVERYLGLSVFGAIPDCGEIDTSSPDYAVRGRRIGVKPKTKK